MIKNMKSLLKFLGVIVVLFVWIELVDFSFYLMNLSDTLWFYVGFLLLARKALAVMIMPLMQ